MTITQKILNLTLVIFVAILSLARLTWLDRFPVSLFSDEVDIGYQVKSFLSTGKDYQGNFIPLQFHSFSDVRTALPIYSTALVSLIPGISVDYAIRLTPAIYSILGLIGIFLLTNSLFEIFDLKEKKAIISPGLLAAFLLSLTPWHFTYSRTGFELSQLFTFFCFGLYFLVNYLRKHRLYELVLSLIFLSLLPAVYSTAKLSVLFLPFLFLTLPEFMKKFISLRPFKIFLLVLFLPLVTLILNGGAGQRFSEIAIHTDPTLSTQTDFLRQADLGKDLVLGSSPSLTSKIAHNKLLRISTAFTKNILGPISTTFLFTKGDPNLRHAVSEWGMMLKIESVLIGLGLFLLISNRKNKFLSFLAILTLLAIVPSALTRDGATHSSRGFMLILPLILSAAYGLYSIWNYRLIPFILTSIIFFESFLYLHDYFYHYPFISEREFHAGLKELVSVANKYQGRTIVLTRTYEPSLIFFLYYTDYPPQMAQDLIPKGKLTEDITEELNLEGKKIAGTNIYLASVRDFDAKDPLRIKDAVYVLPAKEAKGLVESKYAIKLSDDISFPSGEALFYTIFPAKPATNK